MISPWIYVSTYFIKTIIIYGICNVIINFGYLLLLVSKDSNSWFSITSHYWLSLLFDKLIITNITHIILAYESTLIWMAALFYIEVCASLLPFHFLPSLLWADFLLMSAIAALWEFYSRLPLLTLLSPSLAEAAWVCLSPSCLSACTNTGCPLSALSLLPLYPTLCSMK